MNYSEEQTKYMTRIYLSTPNRTTVEILAEEMDKSIKSISENSLGREYTDERFIKQRAGRPRSQRLR